MMVAYLIEVMNLSQHFSEFELSQIPKEENGYIDALSKIASTKNANLFKIILVELLSNSPFD